MEQPFSTELVAGDTWSWTLAPGLDPAVCTLKFFFRGQGGTLDVVATADGGSYAINVPGNATKDLPAGTYSWQACVFDVDGNRTELGRGTVEVLANVEAQGADYDGRSWVKKTLDAIRANLYGLASRADLHYQVGSRSLQTMSRMELLKLEGEFAARYRREQIAAGQLSPNHNQVRARFGYSPTPFKEEDWR